MRTSFNRLLTWAFGKYCKRHDQFYKSDFCGDCLRSKIAREETVDSRPEWTRAEGVWPIGRKKNTSNTI